MLHNTNQFQKKIALLKLESLTELKFLIFWYYVIYFHQTFEYVPKETKIEYVKKVDKFITDFLKLLPLKNREMLIECALYLGSSKDLETNRYSVLESFGFFDLVEDIKHFRGRLVKEYY